MTATMQSARASRPLYGREDLRRLIDPRSVAVIGASETPGSFGARTLDNIRIGYTGKIFPINPRYDTLIGLPCHPGLEDLPEVPDCVIVIVPGEQVEAIVETAARMGVGGVIIYSAGFAEVGTPEQVRTQERIVARARAAGMRLLGPNCVGMANLVSMVGLNFMPKFNEMPMVRGPIGLISQSGALGYCVLQAMERGIGFSHYLSPGNSCDVDVCDMINYLVEDPETSVIACMFEGVRDGARLVEAARRALAADKPLLVYKLANSEISRRTALSHTGTLAGSEVAYRAAFERTGVVVIDSWEEMLECAVLFAKAGHPKAAGVGVMASSGGAAVMAADKAAEFGLSLPAPQDATRARLAAVVPDFGSTANPCDLTAESLRNVQMYADCIRAFADDPAYAAVVVPMMSAQKPATVERAQFLSKLADELPKPMCLVWINEWLQGPGSEVYDASPSIAMFRSMTRCIKALKLWVDHYQRRGPLLAEPGAAAAAAAAADADADADAGRAARARALLECRTGRRTLSESQSKAVLAAWGVPVTREILARDSAGAAAAARDIGFPVAVKIDSADIPHKTEAGVIRLGLANAAGVEQAAAELLAVAAGLPGAPVVDGVLVQQMAGKGVEMMIGARRDPQFGPLVLCGFGGIEVELVRDVAVALAPVSRSQALAMIRSLKKAPLLTGFRGRPPLDVEALADAVCRVSRLACALRGAVAEIDVNPFILGAQGGTAVDALVVIEPEI